MMRISQRTLRIIANSGDIPASNAIQYNDLLFPHYTDDIVIYADEEGYSITLPRYANVNRKFKPAPYT